MVPRSDRVYGVAVMHRLRAMGIRDKPIAPGSPWQNGAERLIGSIRRECVDHAVVWGEAHLRRILTKYAAYYNELRTHGLSTKDVPIIAQSSTWAASYLRPSSAAFITIIAESDFCTAVLRPHQSIEANPNLRELLAALSTNSKVADGKSLRSVEAVQPNFSQASEGWPTS